MRRLLTTTSRAALGILLFTAAATPAHAQLGKLKKMASDAAKDAAAGKKPETPDGSTGAKVDYTVTADRLSAIMAVLAPRVAAAKKEADARQVTADYNAKQKSVSDCYNKSTSAGGVTPDPMAMTTEKGQALTAKSAAMTQRLAAVMQSKNYRAQIALQDTAANMQLQMVALMFPGIKCGSMPYKSAAIIEAEAMKFENASSGNYNANSDELVVPADKRAGMTSGQFGRIREIIAIWLLQQSGDLPAHAHKFTAEETAVLNAKAAELKTYTPLFKDGAMRWATWGDIKSW